MVALQRPIISEPFPSEGVQLSVRVLELLFADWVERNLQVRFWDGSIWRPGSTSDFTIVLNHPGALRKMLAGNELAVGESYIFNDIDIAGDIEAAFRVADCLLSWQKRPLRDKLRLGAMVSKLPQTGRPHAVTRPTNLRGPVHSRRRDQRAIGYHYDIAPEFYGLFLDSTMAYSSGYFRNAEDSLDQAQEQKLDYICKKLDLSAGEKLLDVGCGWGSLIMFAARNYGVHSTGLTLSAQQAAVARRRIAEHGLQNSCEVHLCDYRRFRAPVKFDKVASIGMFEHVGERLLAAYFNYLGDFLRPGGILLNSGIASSAMKQRRGPSFVSRYVFPDGDIVPVSTALRAAERSGLEIRDVENLREHYALTLHHWVKRLEANATEAKRVTDDVTYRIWRLYMAGSTHAFRSGRIHLYQTLLEKPPGTRTRPSTRENWYTACRVV
jgi:cyclopropane-fatty-acyl-phospholipid synthase